MYLSEEERENVQKMLEFEALSDEGKIAELQRQLNVMRVRAADAETRYTDLKIRHEVSTQHRNSVIVNLNSQNSDLRVALTMANFKIAELENKERR